MSDLVVVQKLDLLSTLRNRRAEMTATIDAEITLLETDIKAQAERSGRNFAGCGLQVVGSETSNWNMEVLAGLTKQVPGLAKAKVTTFDTALVKGLAQVYPVLEQARTVKTTWSIRSVGKK